MFRWKKRDDGFEWQHYVRTTIKLRRDARRDKAQRLGEQAAEGARQAARGARDAGVAAGVLARRGALSLGAATGAGLRVAFERAGDFAVALLGLVGLGLGFLARAVGRQLAPLGDILGRPGVAGPLIFAGAIAVAAGLGRMWLGSGGLDAEALSALGIGGTCLTLGLGPALALGHSVFGDLAIAARSALAGPWTATRSAVVASCGLGLAILALAIVRPFSLGLPGLPPLPFINATPVEGSARALAADRLRVANVTIRLTGIVAPEPQQRCRGKGTWTWRCGDAAREATAKLVRGGRVRCEVGSGDGNGTAAGRCGIGGRDIGEALVREGFVFAESGIISRYAAAEREARDAKAGIWAGSEPERPGAWRQRLWDEAKQGAPDGCPIKGRVSRGSRIYLLPWSAQYARVKVSKRRGERWFCTEAEAAAAGWKSEEQGS